MEELLDEFIIVHYIEQTVKVCREKSGYETYENGYRRWYRKTCWHETVYTGITIDLKYAAEFRNELDEIIHSMVDELNNSIDYPINHNIQEIITTATITLTIDTVSLLEDEVTTIYAALKKFEHALRKWYIEKVYPIAIAQKLLG